MDDPKPMIDYLPAAPKGDGWTFLAQLAFTVLIVIPLVAAVLAIAFLLIFWLFLFSFHPGR